MNCLMSPELQCNSAHFLISLNLTLHRSLSGTVPISAMNSPDQYSQLKHYQRKHAHRDFSWYTCESVKAPVGNCIFSLHRGVDCMVA